MTHLPSPVTFLLACAACLAAPVSAAEATHLSLEEALRLAESQNPQVLISREVLEQAAEAKNRARADLLPRVDFAAAQTRSHSAGLYRNAFQAGLDGSVSLLDSTRIATYAASRKSLEVARADFETQMQQVLDSVAALYLAHDRNLRRLELNQSNIERARVLLELSRSQLNAGVATQIDVTRSEAQLAVEEQSLLQQQTLVYESELTLKRTLDLPPANPLTVDSIVITRDLDEDLLRTSGSAVLGQRSDFRSADLAVEQSRLERRAAKLQRVPTIDLNGSFGYQSGRAFDGGERNYWSLGLGVSVPIFDGLRMESNKRLAASRLRQSEVRLNNLQRQVEDEVSFSLRDAQSRRAQIAVARKNADLASEELRLARIRFEQGVADNREVVDAQNRLAAAADNLLDAQYQYALSRLEIARVRGDVKLLLRETGAAAAR